MRHDKWDRALFLHWRVHPESMQCLLPPGLEVDTFDGHAYVGLVLLTEKGVGPSVGCLRGLAITHHGANVRTYVRRKGEPGIYFFSLECDSRLVTLGARMATIPYIPAKMRRTCPHDSSEEWTFSSSRGAAGYVEAAWAVKDAIAPTLLHKFFVERYVVFSTLRNRIVRGQVHHEPWPLHAVEVHRLDFDLFDLSGICPEGEPIAIFSPGVGPVNFDLLTFA